MVGRLACHKLGVQMKTCKLENFSSLTMRSSRFRIFDARGTVMEAEIWMPLLDLMTYTQPIACLVLSFPQNQGLLQTLKFLPRPDWTLN